MENVGIVVEILRFWSFAVEDLKDFIRAGMEWEMSVMKGIFGLGTLITCLRSNLRNFGRMNDW